MTDLAFERYFTLEEAAQWLRPAECMVLLHDRALQALSAASTSIRSSTALRPRWEWTSPRDSAMNQSGRRRVSDPGGRRAGKCTSLLARTQQMSVSHRHAALFGLAAESTAFSELFG